MCRAEIFDRIPSGWNWRPADRRRLRLGRRFPVRSCGRRLNRLRVRARRFGLLLRLIVRLCRLFGIGRRSGAPADGSITVASAPGGPGSRFASSAVCTGFFPVISPRAIAVNSMQIMETIALKTARPARFARRAKRAGGISLLRRPSARKPDIALWKRDDCLLEFLV